MKKYMFFVALLFFILCMLLIYKDISGEEQASSLELMNPGAIQPYRIYIMWYEEPYWMDTNVDCLISTSEGDLYTVDAIRYWQAYSNMAYYASVNLFGKSGYVLCTGYVLGEAYVSTEWEYFNHLDKTVNYLPITKKEGFVAMTVPPMPAIEPYPAPLPADPIPTASPEECKENQDWYAGRCITRPTPAPIFP